MYGSQIAMFVLQVFVSCHLFQDVHQALLVNWTEKYAKFGENIHEVLFSTTTCYPGEELEESV